MALPRGSLWGKKRCKNWGLKTITFRGGEREEPEKKTEKQQGEAKMKKKKLECVASQSQERRGVVVKICVMWLTIRLRWAQKSPSHLKCDLGLCYLSGKGVEGW